MLQQRALAATAAAHDDEDVATEDREVEIALDHEVAVGHIEVFNGDMRLAATATQVPHRADVRLEQLTCLCQAPAP